jgi:hypothetical protein
MKSASNIQICECPPSGLPHTGSDWCTTCSLAVLFAYLSPDYSEIVVEFYWPIELSDPSLNSLSTYESSICEFIIDP